MLFGQETILWAYKGTITDTLINVSILEDQSMKGVTYTFLLRRELDIYCKYSIYYDNRIYNKKCYTSYWPLWHQQLYFIIHPDLFIEAITPFNRKVFDEIIGTIVWNRSGLFQFDNWDECSRQCWHSGGVTGKLTAGWLSFPGKDLDLPLSVTGNRDFYDSSGWTFNCLISNSSAHNKATD